MPFIKGTTNSVTQAQDVYNAISTELTAHAAWSFVETVVIGTEDFHVWKSDGLQNHGGSDFHVFFRLNTSGNGDIQVFTAEDWDATNKVLSRPCFHQRDISSAARYMWMPADGGDWSLRHVPSTTVLDPQIPTYVLDHLPNPEIIARYTLGCADDSLCEYFIGVRPSSLVLATKRHLANAFNGYYIGQLEEISAGTLAPEGVLMWDLVLTPTYQNAPLPSRLKVHADYPVDPGGQLYWVNHDKTMIAWTTRTGTVMHATEANRYDPVFGATLASRAAYKVDQISSDASLYGTAGIIGFFLDQLIITTNTATVAIGDELTVGADVYVFIAGSNWVKKNGTM